jgi:hypothetical protein
MVVGYRPGYAFPEITLGLGDNLDSLLNTILVVDYPSETAYARTQNIQSSLASVGTAQLITAPVTFYDQNVAAITGTFSVQELLAPILQYYRSYSEQTYSDAYQSYVYRIYDGADATPSGPSGNILTMETPTTGYETTYSTLDISFDPNNIFNQIVIQDDAGTVYAQTNNFDSQIISGVQAISTTWAFTSMASIAPAWAEAVVSETDTRVLNNITFNAVNRFGNITYCATSLNSEGPVLVDVKQTQYGVNRELTSLVTRQAHTLTPYGWTITLDLWKGYEFA